MTKLSTRDAILAQIEKIGQAAIELDKTRSQSALGAYQSAKDLLLDAIEAVRIGAPLAE